MKKILIILLSLILCLACACSENKTAEEPPRVQVSEDEMSATVYVTKSGSKYHSYGCIYLKKSCIEKDLSTAEMQGYTPCSVCQ